MAIGYANFSNIQQGNQSVVNSMLGLGKQISSAIENHAATQSAQAMLPMLQQQYQTGMGLIASGHPEGLSNIYQASMVASQNPLLAPMANHAVSMANMANQQVMHNLRTYANIGARMSGAIKPLTPVQLKAAKAMQEDLQMKMDDAARKGDSLGYNRAKQQMDQLKGSLSQFPTGSAGEDPSMSAPDFSTAQKINTLKNNIKTESGKKNMFSKPDQEKIKGWQSELDQLGGGSGGTVLPAVQGGGGVATPPQKLIDYLKKNPNTKDQFNSLFGEGAADQYLKPKTGAIDAGDDSMVAEQPVESDTEDETDAGTMMA